MTDLYRTVSEKAYRLGLPFPKIPQYVLDNIKHSLFDWQKEAFEHFLTSEDVKAVENPHAPTHLMFNMATGTGKTLLMAAMILYYYQKGYRHFLFFVNQSNIVDKTEKNFIDSTHAKYLFTDKIVVNDNTVTIKKVHAFSDSGQNIEIKFTSMQKLYNDIHLQRENQTTLDDLNSKNIVMLADEAHHLNANTRNIAIQKDFLGTALKGSKAEVERKGWEHTVIELILNKNNTQRENSNVLLEFTATIPATESIANKYADKIIYKFGLKEFLQAGYTKEINLIASTLDKKARIIQALLFQWYRHKVALKNGIANFKPVVLFKSKNIAESKTDYKEFLHWVGTIASSDFDFLNTIAKSIAQGKSIHEQGKSRTEQILRFINMRKTSYGEIADWIKQNYQVRNVIITNSANNNTQNEKTDEETEKLLNSLEDSNNHIRAIFTVNRLTEGWDVLNLFDIVRLYEGQNSGGSTHKTPEATIQEKQLIGRGVRYFPFAYGEKMANKRKFDDDLENELRMLEELFYYTYDEDSRYISHLKAELKKDGYITDDREVKTFALKEAFQQCDLFKDTKIWSNKQVQNPYRQKKTLDAVARDFFVAYKIKGLEVTEQAIDFDKQEDLQRLSVSEHRQVIEKQFKDIEKHIVQKAINSKAKQANSLLQFERLKKELAIASIEELQSDKLADFEIKIIASANTDYDDIDNHDKLQLVIKFLDEIFAELKGHIVPKIGGDFVAEDFKQYFAEPKTKNINPKYLDASVVENDWYVLDSFVGTGEEKALISFIKDCIGNLKNQYEEIYLLRNEEVYKIYDFEQGRGFQHDFILFLKPKQAKKAKTKPFYYQIFIEPKGDQFIGDDQTFSTGKEGWKARFLAAISEKYGAGNTLKAENRNYRLFGLPFFNEQYNTAFREAWQSIEKHSV